MRPIHSSGDDADETNNIFESSTNLPHSQATVLPPPICHIDRLPPQYDPWPGRTGGDWCCIRLRRLFFAISLLRAAPSSGLSSSKAHNKSSETLITAPKLSNSAQ